MKKLRKYFVLSLVFALVLTQGAALCATPASDQEADTGAQTAASVGLTKGGESVAKANRAFGFASYKKLFNADENLVFSPYSLSAALNIALDGAKGKTRTEMKKALSASSIKDAALSEGSKNLIECLGASDKVSVANGLFVTHDAVLSDGFAANAENVHKAKVQSVDFTDPNTPGLINGWVKENTNGMIEEMSGNYDEDTFMSIINAVAFDAKWQSSFKQTSTYDAAFNGAGGSKTVKMMGSSGIKAYYENKSYQAVMLPYEDGRFGLLVVLPRQGKKLSSVTNSILSEKAFSKLLTSLKDTDIELGLPRFSILCDLPLNDMLKSLGMKRAFDPERADFSGISGSSELYISSVLQKARIDVAEEGTKAAAATEVVINVVSMPVSPSKKMTCDRPFFFAIVDSLTNQCLFMGAANDIGE